MLASNFTQPSNVSYIAVVQKRTCNEACARNSAHGGKQTMYISAAASATTRTKVGRCTHASTASSADRTALDYLSQVQWFGPYSWLLGLRSSQCYSADAEDL